MAKRTETKPDVDRVLHDDTFRLNADDDLRDDEKPQAFAADGTVADEDDEAEAEAPRLDVCEPGGRYITERGRYVDAHGTDLGPAPKKRK